MKTSREERIKLFANYLNILAAGLIIAGVVTPAAAIVDLGSGHHDVYVVASFAASAIVLSIVLHVIAQAVLGSL